MITELQTFERGSLGALTRPLRLGLIGLGQIGRVHLANLSDLQEARVVSVAEPAPLGEPSLEASIQHCRGWEDVVADRTLDAVLITLPHALHAECAKKALAAGLHVFLEKPLATTWEDARQVVEAARVADRTLMVNMTHRFYPPIRMARRMVQEGELGEVIAVHDHYMEVIDRSAFPAWFFDPELSGGGVTMTDSIHLLDRVSWVLGEPLRLAGQVARRLDPGSKAEDCSELLCASASGIPVTVGSFFCFGGERSWADRLTLFGSRGTLVAQAWSHLEWTPHGKPMQRIEAYPDGLAHEERSLLGHRAALREFLDAIQSGREPEASGRQVLNAQEIVQCFHDRLADGSV